jgi:hypothetical protein
VRELTWDLSWPATTRDVIARYDEYHLHAGNLNNQNCSGGTRVTLRAVAKFRMFDSRRGYRFRSDCD